MHQEALDILVRVARQRQTSNKKEACIVEIMTADVKEAWNQRRRGMQEMAGEALDVALFTGDLNEAIEGIERDIKDKDDTLKGIGDMTLG